MVEVISSILIIPKPNVSPSINEMTNGAGYFNWKICKLS
jgi:hypothetical protein